jgi:hypothetical protein
MAWTPGIPAYLQNGDTVEHAQQIAAHQSPCVSLDEVERIKF